MELYQSQHTQVKEVFLKKQNSILLFIIFFFLLNFFSLSVCGEENKNTYKEKIINYFDNFSEFSSTFIQYDNNAFQEGQLFLKRNRLRVQYNNPTKIVLVVKENNAMYYNVDLEEVEYFNPKKTISKIFFDLFYEQEFLINSNIEISEGSISLEKKVIINDENNIIKIYFEKSPLRLRKIIVSNPEGSMTFTINNPNYNPNLNDDLFSLANPLLS